MRALLRRGLFVNAFPVSVLWCYALFATVFVIGMITIFSRGEWQNARSVDRLLLLGPVFYAAPLAAFGSEHFTLTEPIASIIPKWIPWHHFWVYLLGACFIAAALSLATRIQARLTAAILALTFFLFVVLMHAPGAVRTGSRFALAVALRETTFSGGALALACYLTAYRTRLTHVALTIARYFVAIPVVYVTVEQFLHADHVPGIPLQKVTPTWLFGHAAWTYVVAAIYAVAVVFLLFGIKARAATIWLATTVLVLELAVYVPIAIVERTTLEGFNYLADTLMFCGTLLLLARALPSESTHLTQKVVAFRTAE